MAQPVSLPEPSSAPDQVWRCLAPDRQAQALQLLVQLAWNLLQQRAAAVAPEGSHVLTPPPAEDPADAS